MQLEHLSPYRDPCHHPASPANPFYYSSLTTSSFPDATRTSSLQFLKEPLVSSQQHTAQCCFWPVLRQCWIRVGMDQRSFRIALLMLPQALIYPMQKAGSKMQCKGGSDSFRRGRPWAAMTRSAC